ncbi:MAG: 4Fe-4S binding protein [Candidatus Omnitrophica bacterium]|nr:4Fe-4S binding protein [Candidatus Omnitrophota bacterium]MDD5574633.1 4Fe-4S binding protein [Candidatus Omnitrophota bacterium]
MKPAIQAARKIIEIDEDKCNGCGLCIPNCREGALRIVDGKAKLVSDRYCDGLGACLGVCPQGAIRMVERPAEAFDEKAAAGQKEMQPSGDGAAAGRCPSTGGCPSARALGLTRRLQEKRACAGAGKKTENAVSEMMNWPVQLALVPVDAPYLQDADVLLAADCVGFSYPDLHQGLLSGKVLLVACPKLDRADLYADKLARMFRQNRIRSLTIARMEVPCCGGLNMIVEEALARAGQQIPVETVIVTIEGTVKN